MIDEFYEDSGCKILYMSMENELSAAIKGDGDVCEDLRSLLCFTYV